MSMKKFEKPSLNECKEMIHRLQGKTVEEMIVMFGQPTHEQGSRTENRLANGKPWVVEVRRSFVFYGVGKTIHRLGIVELADGKFEFHMRGREIVDEKAAE
jgi:hypothetical protein